MATRPTRTESRRKTTRKTGRKVAAKKARKKKTSRKASTRSATENRKRAVEAEEKDTYIFCTHRMGEFVDPATSWRKFKAGKIEQFRFHESRVRPEARKTEIEIFAARLDKYLLGLGYAGAEGARYSIRNAVETAENPMQDLLDVVAKSYKS